MYKSSTRSTSYKIRHNRGPAAAHILVITAAHAVGSAARIEATVGIAGVGLPAHAVREGYSSEWV